MGQQITLLGEVINTTDTPLHIALRRRHKHNKYTFTYGPAGNFIMRSHKYNKYTFTYGAA